LEKNFANYSDHQAMSAKLAWYPSMGVGDNQRAEGGIDCRSPLLGVHWRATAAVLMVVSPYSLPVDGKEAPHGFTRTALLSLVFLFAL
jgi:hypothetical protein